MSSIKTVSIPKCFLVKASNDRLLFEWARIYGCPLSIEQNYCRHIQFKNRLPRGMRGYADKLRSKLLNHINPPSIKFTEKDLNNCMMAIGINNYSYK